MTMHRFTATVTHEDELPGCAIIMFIIQFVF